MIVARTFSSVTSSAPATICLRTFGASNGFGVGVGVFVGKTAGCCVGVGVGVGVATPVELKSIITMWMIGAVTPEVYAIFRIPVPSVA